MFALRLVAAAAFVAGPCAPQTVWSMGAPWTDLNTVFAAAAPGDIVLLNGMTFAPFALSKGLTLVGPGTIVPVPAFPQYAVSTLSIPPGQRAHVAGISFLPLSGTGWILMAHMVSATGTVTFEDCTFSTGTPHSLSVAGTILLHRCTCTPSPPPQVANTAGGVHVHGGVCWITDSTLNGAPAFHNSSGPPNVITGTPALRVSSGTVCVSNSTLTGGLGMTDPWGPGSMPGQPAITAQGGFVSITDCTLTGGNSIPNSYLPGPVALAAAGGTASHARTTLTGGGGNPPGAPSSGSVAQVPQLIGMAIAQPFRLGLTTQLIATAGTSQLLGMIAAFDPTPAWHLVVLGPFLGAVPTIPLLVAAPLAGAQVVHTVSVPNQPQLLGFVVFAQAFQFEGAFVRVSAAVGGVVH